MAEKPYSDIYNKLVRDKDDTIGMIAYCSYKIQKIEFIEMFYAECQRYPNEIEIGIFHKTTATNQSIASYRNKGQAVLDLLIKDRL